LVGEEKKGERLGGENCAEVQATGPSADGWRRMRRRKRRR
jgi:hypothetical protein